MEGKIVIDHKPEADVYFEVRFFLQFTAKDILEAELSGDVMEALVRVVDTAQEFSTKLSAIVALVGAVQDRHKNPVLRLTRLDIKRPARPK